MAPTLHAQARFVGGSRRKRRGKTTHATSPAAAAALRSLPRRSKKSSSPKLSVKTKSLDLGSGTEESSPTSVVREAVLNEAYHSNHPNATKASSSPKDVAAEARPPKPNAKHASATSIVAEIVSGNHLHDTLHEVATTSSPQSSNVDLPEPTVFSKPTATRAIEDRTPAVRALPLETLPRLPTSSTPPIPSSIDERHVGKSSLSPPVASSRFGPVSNMRGTTKDAVSNPSRSTLALPLYAIYLIDTCNATCSAYRRAVFVWTVAMVTGPVCTVAAAVWYAHNYGGYPTLEDHEALTLFVLTVVLPMLVMLVIRRRRTLVSDLATLRFGTRAIESELFQCRAQLGKYDKAGDDSEGYLLHRLQGLWTPMKTWVLLPDHFWSYAADADTGSGDVTDSNADNPAASETTPFLSHDRDLSAATDIVSHYTSVEDLEHRRNWLSTNEYIHQRVEPHLDHTEKLIASCHVKHKIVTGAVMTFTFGTSLVALASMQWLIPFVMALSAAGTSVLDVGGFETAAKQDQNQVDLLQGYIEELEELDDDVESAVETKSLLMEMEQVIVE